MDIGIRDGIYRYTDANGDILDISVKQTPGKIIIKKIEDTRRYDYSHMDMLLGNTGKAEISKARSPHCINSGDGFFVIYPFRAGVPFLFDLISDSKEK